MLELSPVHLPQLFMAEVLQIIKSLEKPPVTKIIIVTKNVSNEICM